MRLLSSVFVLLMTAAAGSAGRPTTPSERYFMALAASTCSSAGQIICSATCDQVLLCVSDGTGGFETAELEACSGSSRCSADQQTCVTGGSACGGSTAEGIECHAQGLFPDPYNCTVYHICVADNTMSLPMVCDEGWAYDPLSTDCSKALTDRACTEGPVETCLSVGQTGALADNPSIYYVCVNKDGTLIPDLYKCAHGEEYDPDKYSCVNASTSTTSASPTTASPTTSAPTTTATASPPGPTPGGWCPTPLEVVADPDDCTRYYECSLWHTWLHLGCIIGTYFNPEHGRCEIGFC